MRSRSWACALALWAVLDVALLGLTGSAAADGLETVTDDELRKLIEQETYVVVLFAPGDAEDKDVDRTADLEAELASVRESVVDSLNAWVVKAVGSALKADYAPGPGPAVVFFRARDPVLYDGPANEEEMLETISAFKDTCTQDLNDSNFEHLTQASTGATTGDWLVLFVREDCADCDRLRARLETVACRMRGRMNVARVNRDTSGPVTARRFGVLETPQLVFFRLGKMYRYTIGRFDVQSLTDFVTGWYKNVEAEPIPLPKTPFDDLVQLCVDYLKENPAMCAAVGGVPLLLAIAFFFLLRGDSEPPKKKKKKKKKEEGKDS